jgi:CelD/BcsL family acetyltransferase involved in cellulose biosynthesis
LHQIEWKKRGEPGAFSNEYFYLFHRELIRTRFDRNEIQLLRIRSGTITIGILYSFVYQGDVLFYQSGFRYSTENVHRPGLVSHYLAVLHNARKGMKTYDFLAGDSAYKSSLSTDSTTMCWLRFVRNRRRLCLEKNLLVFKRQLKSLASRLHRSES